MMRTKTFGLLVAGAFFASLMSGCTASTDSTEVAVRTVKLGITGRGIIEEAYPQGGTFFFFRPLSEWNVYDIALQNLAMLRDEKGGDDSINFKTVDGNDISVSVTISWSVDPAKVAYILRHVGTSTADVEHKLVRPVSRTIVRDVLNQLTSEEYYQANRRFEMVETARDMLNEMLMPQGVVIAQILLGEHRFNQTYEQIIRDKKVAEQEAARLISATQSAVEEMKRDLEAEKGNVMQAVEKANGESERRKLEADAFLFEKQQQADAILTEKKASAKGLTEQAKALAGSGGKNMVKLEVARALKGKKIVFVPAGSGMDLRTTDINKLLTAYGVKAASGN